MKMLGEDFSCYLLQEGSLSPAKLKDIRGTWQNPEILQHIIHGVQEPIKTMSYEKK